MFYRSLGKTGIKVSEIGMGCNRLGERDMPDEHWVGLVRRAVDLGVNLFDTAEAYGWGRSEDILGQALGNRPGVYIATKVSRIRETDEDEFSAGRIMTQVEGSLKRLRRDCIDIYQLHTPSLADIQRFDWPVAFAKLKEQGKIRFPGVSILDAASARWLIEQGLAEVMQVEYSIVTPEVGREVFPLALAAGVGTMVRMPMAQGILSGKFRPGEPVPAGHRALRAEERMPMLIERAETLRPVAEKAGLPMSHLALAYAIAPDGVSAAIPGARNVEQLEHNVAASTGVALPADVLAEIEATQRSWQQ